MSATKLHVLKRISEELRRLNTHGSVRQHPMFVHVLGLYRGYQATPAKYCRGPREMQHMANTYLCLLENVRKYQELCEHYKGAGERSTEEAANIVGLQLPPNNKPT